MEHGGDIGDAARRYGIDPGDWLDLSTGINPRAYDTGPIPATCLRRLPEPEQLTALTDAARAAYRIPGHAHVTAAPGTQALIQLLARAHAPCRVAVVGPTYSEHAIAWRACGHEVMETSEPPPRDADVVIVVNPNNPDGRRIVPDRLAQLAGELAARDGLLIVDEAFADPHPEISLSPRTGIPGLVVLRSFGKFYGLAGVRLGFAVTTQALGERLASALGPWAVSGPAIHAGMQALCDIEWQQRTRTWLASQSKTLDAVLTAHGLVIVGGTALFRLASAPDAGRLQAGLASHGVWVRKFSYASNWLRFGLPADDADFQRLDAALSETLSPAQSPNGPHAALG